MDFYFLFLLYRKRNIDLLATHFARKRNLFVKVQGIEITRCTLAGLTRPAGKRDYMENFQPGLPGSRHRDTGISANRAGPVVM